MQSASLQGLLFLLFSLLWSTASCLAAAASSSTSPTPFYSSSPLEGGSNSNGPKIACIISTNKNGGYSNAFTFASSSSATAITSNVTLWKRTFRHWNQQPSKVMQSVQSGFRSTFLPSGYPNKTPVGYLSYAMWSWIQDLSTQLRGVLATQRILEGVGVGREGATALSALLNFMLRDGCGMAATLLFTSVAASRFGADIKRWRLFADIMVDVGMTLEVAAVSVPPQYFLPMICVGNMCKAICGVAAGACGGAINLHWAKGSDISDINAKFSAQNTVTGSLGLIFAAVFARSVTSLAAHKLWLLYGALTALHIYANRRCMRLIAFDYLNTVRMRMVVADFFSNCYPYSGLLLPPPKVIAQEEPLLFLPKRFRNRSDKKLMRVPILFGTDFPKFAQLSGWNEDDLKRALAHDSSYVVATGLVPKSKSKSSRKGRQQSLPQRLVIAVAVMSDSTGLQRTKAYFHALLLKRRLGESIQELDEDSQLRLLELQTMSQVNDAWKSFCKDCKRAGWDLKHSELRNTGYEVSVQFRKT